MAIVFALEWQLALQDSAEGAMTSVAGVAPSTGILNIEFPGPWWSRRTLAGVGPRTVKEVNSSHDASRAFAEAGAVLR